MTPQQELNYLKGFVKLSEQDAVKRNTLEGFLNSPSKVLLLDADSLLFKIANYSLGTDEETDLEKQYQDYHAQIRAIALEIEQDGVYVDKVVHYFTTSKNNFRYSIYPEYKANRKALDEKTRNLLAHVSLLKHYIIAMLESKDELVRQDDMYEADDLIGFDCEVLDTNSSIICSIDKDLRQLEGFHFDYYRKDGQYKGWQYVSKEKGYNNFLKLLAMGDTADNIIGLKGIGEKRAEKMLDSTELANLVKVARKYVETDGNLERFKMNYKLIRL